MVEAEYSPLHAMQLEKTQSLDGVSYITGDVSVL